MGKLMPVSWDRMAGSFLSPRAIETANRVLGAVFIGLFAICLWNLCSQTPERKFRRILSEIKNRPAAAASVSAPSQPHDEAYYVNAVSGSKLFKISVSNAGSPLAPKVNPLEKINLVGILPGANVQAILENTETQKTYYLTVGQAEDGLTVESIQGSAVSVRSGEERKSYNL